MLTAMCIYGWKASRPVDMWQTGTFPAAPLPALPPAVMEWGWEKNADVGSQQVHTQLHTLSVFTLHTWGIRFKILILKAL